jgi:hypothetical protein
MYPEDGTHCAYPGCDWVGAEKYTTCLEFIKIEPRPSSGIAVLMNQRAVETFNLMCIIYYLSQAARPIAQDLNAEAINVR